MLAPQHYIEVGQLRAERDDAATRRQLIDAVMRWPENRRIFATIMREMGIYYAGEYFGDIEMPFTGRERFLIC